MHASPKWLGWRWRAGEKRRRVRVVILPDLPAAHAGSKWTFPTELFGRHERAVAFVHTCRFQIAYFFDPPEPENIRSHIVFRYFCDLFTDAFPGWLEWRAGETCNPSDVPKTNFWEDTQFRNGLPN